jgi:hypothetical protein
MLTPESLLELRAVLKQNSFGMIDRGKLPAMIVVISDVTSLRRLFALPRGQ